ncbi:unnamed protein product [Caenorhabditis brenneri]
MSAIYESTFAKTPKTDAILVIDGKKLHVNKALLSYHSDYFKELFNTPGKSEFVIEDVKFEDFATLLSLIQHNPLKVAESNAERLLALGMEFRIPAARRHVESFLITSTRKDKWEKIRLADEYELENLLAHGLLQFKTNVEFTGLKKNEKYNSLSDKTKVAICHRFFDMIQY